MARKVNNPLAVSINRPVNQWGTIFSHITSICVTEEEIQRYVLGGFTVATCDFWCFSVSVFTLRGIQ